MPFHAFSALSCLGLGTFEDQVGSQVCQKTVLWLAMKMFFDSIDRVVVDIVGVHALVPGFWESIKGMKRQKKHEKA